MLSSCIDNSCSIDKSKFINYFLLQSLISMRFKQWLNKTDRFYSNSLGNIANIQGVPKNPKTIEITYC